MAYIGYGGNMPPCGVPPPMPYPPVPIVDNRHHRRHHHHHDHHHDDRRGDRGDRGDQGPPGPSGRVINVSGSFSIMAGTPLANGAPVRVGITSGSFSDGITASNDVLRFRTAGTYMVNLTIPVSRGTGGADNITVRVTGNPTISGTPSIIGQTTLDGEESSDISSGFVVKASSNSELGLYITASGDNAVPVNVGQGTISAALIAQT